MTHLPLVTKEQALWLKEIGFDWPCEHYFWNTEERKGFVRLNHNKLKSHPHISRPTIALALQWLWEAKGVYVSEEIHGNYSAPEFGFDVIDKNNGELIYSSEYEYATPQEVKSAGLDAATRYVKERGA